MYQQCSLVRFIILLGVRRPQGQVVPQELHDQSAVLVAIILEHVQVSYRVIKCLQRSFLVHHMHAHTPYP